VLTSSIFRFLFLLTHSRVLVHRTIVALKMFYDDDIDDDDDLEAAGDEVDEETQRRNPSRRIPESSTIVNPGTTST